MFLWGCCCISLFLGSFAAGKGFRLWLAVCFTPVPPNQSIIFVAGRLKSGVSGPLSQKDPLIQFRLIGENEGRQKIPMRLGELREKLGDLPGLIGIFQGRTMIFPMRLGAKHNPPHRESLG